MNRIATLIAGIAGLALCATSGAADIDWNRVDQALGKAGANQPGGVHKYSLPRTDLKIVVDGVVIRPALALGSWVAFMPMGSGAMFMGDLVLTESEISPVMKRLIDDGVQITAIHNHLLRTSPAVFYMHVGGQGDPVTVILPDNTTKSLPKTVGHLAIETPMAGLYAVVMGSVTNRFAVNALAAEESDLSRCASGQWGAWAEDTQRQLAETSAVWIFGLVALALLTAHLYLLAAGKGTR